MRVYYSRLRKRMGLEGKVGVPVPNKIARRINKLAEQLRERKKES